MHKGLAQQEKPAETTKQGAKMSQKELEDQNRMFSCWRIQNKATQQHFLER